MREVQAYYVEILPSNFVNPQKEWAYARVYGEMTAKDGQIVGCEDLACVFGRDGIRVQQDVV
jgi:hypothetical protein